MALLIFEMKLGFTSENLNHLGYMHFHGAWESLGKVKHDWDNSILNDI